MQLTASEKEHGTKAIKLKALLENNLVSQMRQTIVTASLGLAFLGFLWGEKKSFVSRPYVVFGPLVLLVISIVLGLGALLSYHRRLNVIEDDEIHDTNRVIYYVCFGATLTFILAFTIALPVYMWKQLSGGGVGTGPR